MRDQYARAREPLRRAPNAQHVDILGSGGIGGYERGGDLAGHDHPLPQPGSRVEDLPVVDGE
jgi:hypothetical protein